MGLEERRKEIVDFIEKASEEDNQELALFIARLEQRQSGKNSKLDLDKYSIICKGRFDKKH